MNSIPKSLHTVRVFTTFARQKMEQGETPEGAVDFVIQSLGYDPQEDEHGLRDRVLAQLAVS
jgi:hypothetical protein